MRRRGLLVVALAGGLACASTPRPARPTVEVLKLSRWATLATGQGRLMGVAVDAASGEPIAGATIVLNAANRDELMMISDDDGRFTLDFFGGRTRVTVYYGDAEAIQTISVPPGFVVETVLAVPAIRAPRREL